MWLMTLPVQAEPTEARLERLPGETDQQLVQRGQRELFQQAVFDTAINLIPGNLAALRQELLRDFLTGRADGYVQAYSGLNEQVYADELVIAADVTVNADALGDLLKDLGLTRSSSFMGYSLRLGEGARASGEEVGRLAFLSGLTSVAGAQTVLTLERFENGSWAGWLESERGRFVGESTNLDDLWLDLWGRYFGGQVRETQGPSVRLVVSGWYAPAAIRAFDKELKDMSTELARAELAQLAATPDGLAAVWLVPTNDPEGLRTRIGGTLQSRGLRYTLEPVGVALPGEMPETAAPGEQQP
jgi:hypothetical protein